MNISIVIPCYNEEDAISVVVPKAIASLNSLQKDHTLESYEVIVVNDGSTDKSLIELNRYKKLKVITHDKNKGYGAALKTGIQASRMNYIATFDMDDTYPTQQLKDLILQTSPSCPAAVGIRSHSHSGMPGIRSIGNQFFTQLIRVLFSKEIKDPCSGMWVFKKSLIINQLAKFPNKLQFTLYLTLYLLKNKISFQQIPIKYGKREGQSKLNPFKDGIMFLYIIIKNRLV